MKNVKTHVTLTAALLMIVVGFALMAARSSRGQSPSGPQKSDSLVKPTVLATDRTGTKKTAVASFAEAATQNAALRNELTWTFGSKQQHGWYLYDLLIGQTLNISHDAST